MNDQYKQHMLELCDAACNDGLSEEQFARLETLLASDPECRQLYLRYLSLDTDLALTFGEWTPSLPAAELTVQRIDSEQTTAGSAPVTRSTRRGEIVSGWMRGVAHDFVEQPVALVVLVLSLVSGGLLIWGLSQSGPEQPPVAQQPQSAVPFPIAKAPPNDVPTRNPKAEIHHTVVARLRGTRDVAWGETAWTVNSEIRAGQVLSLKQGLAEIEFDTGAKVILEGPAELKFGGGRSEVGANAKGDTIPHSAFPDSHSFNACSLTLGKLVASVPLKASGFTVHTPTMTIVDKGTQFGVTVNLPDQFEFQDPKSKILSTKVQVFQGLVEVQRHVAQSPKSLIPNRAARESGSSQMVKAGEAVTSNPDSQLQKIEGNPQGYVRELPPAEHQPAELLPLATWPKDSPLKPGDIVAVANAPTRFHLFKIDPSTGEQKLLATGMPYSQTAIDHGLKWCSVAVEPDGNILVGVKGLGAKNAGILRIDPRRDRISVLTSGGLLTQGSINGLAVAADGTIYATYESAIHNTADYVLKIDPASGTVTTLARFGGDIRGVCFDLGGRGLVVCSHKDSIIGLAQLVPKPKVTPWDFDGSLGWFDCVAVDPQGRIFVGAVPPQASGPGDHTIYEIGRGAGHPVKSLAVVPGWPVAMACNADGHLLLGPSHKNLRVHRMDVGTRKLTVVTSGGMLADETFIAVVPGSPTATGGETQ